VFAATCHQRHVASLQLQRLLFTCSVNVNAAARHDMQPQAFLAREAQGRAFFDGARSQQSALQA